MTLFWVHAEDGATYSGDYWTAFRSFVSRGEADVFIAETLEERPNASITLVEGEELDIDEDADDEGEGR